jgi:hypothetical protein
MRRVVGCIILAMVLHVSRQSYAMRASTQEKAEKTLSSGAQEAVKVRQEGTKTNKSSRSTLLQPDDGQPTSQPLPKRSGTILGGSLLKKKRILYTQADKRACEKRGGRIELLYNNKTRVTRNIINAIPQRVTGWTCHFIQPKEAHE